MNTAEDAMDADAAPLRGSSIQHHHRSLTVGVASDGETGTDSATGLQRQHC